MRLLIIGATGLVGTNLIKLIENSDILVDDICFVSSSKSFNKEILFRNKKYRTTTFELVDLSKYNIACITSNALVSLKVFPILKELEYIIIDNSSAFRDSYDLTIPKVYMDLNSTIFINPNCCVIQCLIPLFYINQESIIKKIIYNTYQSLSGGGYNLLDSKLTSCIPLIGLLSSNSSEEIKLINETKKILKTDVEVIANCVRVPVDVGHLVNIIIEVESNIETIRTILINNTIYLEDVIMPNLDENNNVYTTRLKQLDDKTFSFYTYANNLLRGSSFNTFETINELYKNIKTLQ